MYSKKIIITALIVASLSAKLKPAIVEDCLDANYENNCYSSIKASFKGYVYLRSKAFSSQYNSVDFAVTLKKGMEYVFSIHDNYKQKNAMTMRLYNSDGKLVAISADSKIIFKPEEAGKYHVSSSFADNTNEANCCIILYGMIN